MMFNSGSSANLALLSSLQQIGFLKEGDNIGFSTLTWATNVMPMIQLGFNPVPIDVNLDTFNINEDDLLKKIYRLKAVFITNALGFCSDLDMIKKICEDNHILLLEYNCESLGSVYKGVKLGNFGLASTFSFFVGHHLSTIEGGMVCTDDYVLYNVLKSVREHGWLRNNSVDFKK